MKVFLDTNVFYNNWFLDSAHFKYFFHYLNNEEHELMISELVIQEVENLWRKQANGHVSDINKCIDKLRKLSADRIPDFTENYVLREYELLPLLNDKVDALSLIGYEDLSHKDVVSRALVSKRPFQDKEKGYRDTLIWLSFLKYVANLEGEKVLFITENKSDFLVQKGDELKFHADLEVDISDKAKGVNIVPLASLRSFVDAHIDKDEHAIDRANSEAFEDYAEESSIGFIQDFTNIQLAEYFESSIFHSRVKNILGIRVDVWEGVEDPEFLSTSLIENGDVYVGYSYNLRRVTIEIDVPRDDYLAYQHELNGLFFEAQVSSDVVTLIAYVRPYFQVSFIYNIQDKAFKDFTVDALWLRR